MSTTLYRQISEKAFTAQVIQLAHYFGWLVAHQRPAMTKTGWRTAISGDVGFPDLILVKPKREVIAAELKTERGKLTVSQEKWIEYFKAAGARGCVWRPSMIEQIELILK